ncbi:DNA polymerase V [Klebsiella oxytoca]|uniref:DNA polymerase V n=1 Tax=Klebsiella oxytoca TaxID=571 RepID=UPI001CCA9B18|nr:DNA polymerase V [Klebsiella oxytoca]MBZ7262499.1 DNA polymerase V [Klebsiella oxytoca]
MARNSDIEIAWRKAIVIEQTGRRTVTTSRFLRELAEHGWVWSPRQANKWIEHYVTTFRDVSTQEGDERTFQLYNPNGGL